MKVTKRRAMLTKTEEDQVRYAQLAQVFATADSALAGRRVTVQIIPKDSDKARMVGTGAPAFTVEGSQVHICELEGHSPFLSTSGLIVANGLNYHELCHVLYTPGAKTRLVTRINQLAGSAGAQAFNILEDQRIEGIMTTRFTTTKHYLTATVAEYFLNVDFVERGRSSREECLAESWPIIYGRRYLPKHVRDHFRTVSNDPAYRNWTVAQLRRMEAIIDEYIGIRFGKVMSAIMADKAAGLVVEFSELLSKGKRILSDNTNVPNPFGHPTANTGSAQVSDAGMQGGESQDVDGDDQTPGGASDNGSGGGKGDDDADGDGDNGAPEDGDGSNGTGTGDGSDAPAPDTIGTLRKAIDDAASDVEVQSNVSQQNRTLTAKGSKFNGVLDTAQHTAHKASPEYAGQAAAFRKQLARISEDADPGFDRGHDSGRLNIMRAVRGDSLDTVFDLWKEGKQDAASIELVVLLDRSYSMSRQMEQACEAAWSIKFGLDGLGGDARCSVITFGSRSAYLYRPNDVSSSQPRHTSAHGGTTALPAVTEALRIMARSERKKKILISVSDGMWDDRSEAVEVVQRLKAGGVVTAALHLTDDNQERMVAGMNATQSKNYNDMIRNEHELFVLGNSPLAITKLGKTLVKAAMRG